MKIREVRFLPKKNLIWGLVQDLAEIELVGCMHYRKSVDPRRFCLDVIITSRVSVEDGLKVYIPLDVLDFLVMGRQRATFRIFYVVDYRPRPISPA